MALIETIVPGASKATNITAGGAHCMEKCMEKCGPKETHGQWARGCFQLLQVSSQKPWVKVEPQFLRLQWIYPINPIHDLYKELQLEPTNMVI